MCKTGLIYRKKRAAILIGFVKSVFLRCEDFSTKKWGIEKSVSPKKERLLKNSTTLLRLPVSKGRLLAGSYSHYFFV